MRKKASIIDLLVWIAVAFVIILFFAMWIYGFDIITTTLVDMPGTSSVNISEQAEKTFGVINPVQTKYLHLLAFVMIFIMGISILISNFLIKANPAFFIVYVFIVIAGVMASVPISNQYESLMVDPVLGTTISEFTAASFIMLNLPLWTTIIGIFGAIFLFAGILRDAGLGGPVT